MSTTCAICMALGRLPLGPLLPNIVTYRGYSLCMEHMQLWEGCRREDGTTAEWEDVMAFARAPVVVKVDLSDTDTVEEKMEKLEEAAAEFDDPVTDAIDRISYPPHEGYGPDESVVDSPMEVEVKAVTSDGEEIPLEPGDVLSTKPKKRKKKGKRKSKKKKGGKKK